MAGSRDNSRDAGGFWEVRAAGCKHITNRIICATIESRKKFRITRKTTENKLFSAVLLVETTGLDCIFAPVGAKIKVATSF